MICSGLRWFDVVTGIMMQPRQNETHRPQHAALAKENISGGNMAFDANTNPALTPRWRMPEGNRAAGHRNVSQKRNEIVTQAQFALWPQARSARVQIAAVRRHAPALLRSSMA